MATSAAVVAAGVGALPPAAAQARPNVIVVMSDDQTAQSMRFMDVVRSRIGDRGATFRRSVTNWPLCCPSRATFFTGQYALNHDVRGNAAPDGRYERFKALHQTNNLATWLRAGGYYTGFVGKYMNGYGVADPTELPPGWDEWYGAGLRDQWVYDYPLNENGALVEYGSRAKDFKGDVLTRKARRFIKRRAPKQQPFFLFVGYTAPHSGFPNPSPRPPDNCNITAKPAPRHADSLNHEPLPRPPNFNELDVSDKPQAIQALPRLDANKIKQRRRTYRCRAESLLHVDEGVGKMLDALKRTHELANTLVIYLSDNGFFSGEHRLQLPHPKDQVYEEALRVPLQMRGPGISRDVTVRDLAINADLAPTILDAAEVNAGLATDGRSLLPAARRPIIQRGRELLIEKGLIDDADPDDPGSFIAVRNRRYIYVEHGQPFSGEVELYDLEADPFQLHSKHDRAAYDGVQALLAARLADLRECAGESCRRLPELTFDLDFETGREEGRQCAKRPVIATVEGADSDQVLKVAFRINGRTVRTDTDAPFRRWLPHKRLKQRGRSTVEPVVDLADGRRRSFQRTIRACG